MDTTNTFLGLLEKLQCINKKDKQEYLTDNNRYSRPFIISRKKDGLKYQNSSRLIQNLGLNPIRFNAVEGTEIKDIEFFRFNFPLLRPGEMGCLASHLSILALASQHPNQDQFTLVFEDDIVSQLTKDAFDKHLDELWRVSRAKKASIVHLGKCLESCSKITPVENSPGIYHSYAPSCAHALAIRNSFAKKVMEEMKDYNMGIDSILGDYVKNGVVVGLTFHPGLFYQDVLNLESGLRNKKEQMINYLECNDTCGERTCPISVREEEDVKKPEAIQNPQAKPQDQPKRVNKPRLEIIIIAIVLAIVCAVVAYFVARWRCKSIKRALGIAVIIALVVCVIIITGEIIVCNLSNNKESSNSTASRDIQDGKKPQGSNPLLTEEKPLLLSVNKESLQLGYKVFNPTNVMYKGYLWTSIRATNDHHSYTIVRASTLDGKKIISETIIDPSTRGNGWNDDKNREKRDKILKNAPCQKGLEDMRLFVFKDKLWLIGVNLDANLCKPRMCMMDLTTYLERKEEKIIPLVYEPVMNGPNKNWAPMVVQQPHGEVLFIVIDVDPLLIVKPDLDTGRCHLVHQGNERKHPQLFNLPRNSTITIPINQEITKIGLNGSINNSRQYLMMVHSKYVHESIIPALRFVYFQHRFCVIDIDTMTTTLSEPFNIEQPGLPNIEYISSIWLDETNREALIGYGLRDNQAKTVRISYDKINRLMKKTIL